MMKDKIRLTMVGHGIVRLSATCPLCKREWSFEMPWREFAEGNRAWIDGTLAQDAFPGVSPKDREMFISGTCHNCWLETFGIN